MSSSDVPAHEIDTEIDERTASTYPACRSGVDPASDILRRSLAIDLEVEPSAARILEFAAVRPGSEEAIVFRGGDLVEALRHLEQFAASADFLLGHNVIRFDLRHLTAAAGQQALIHKPAIDTLWLNPLAFPKNPYHRLVNVPRGPRTS